MELFYLKMFHSGHIFAIAVQTEGNYFATGGNDGNLNVFRTFYENRFIKR